MDKFGQTLVVRLVMRLLKTNTRRIILLDEPEKCVLNDALREIVRSDALDELQMFS